MIYVKLVPYSSYTNLYITLSCSSSDSMYLTKSNCIYDDYYPGTNVGGIVGSVVGGIIFLFIIIFICNKYKRRPLILREKLLETDQYREPTTNYVTSN